MASSCSLAGLPPELLVHVTNRLTSFRDLAYLATTSRELNQRLTPILYHHAARVYTGILPWACSKPELTKTVAHLLAAGADPSLQVLHIGQTDNVNKPFMSASIIFKDEDKYAVGMKFHPGRYEYYRKLADPTYEPELQALDTYPSFDPGRGLPSSIRTTKDWDKDVWFLWNGRAHWHATWSPIHNAVETRNFETLALLLDHKMGSLLLECPALGYGQYRSFDNWAMGRRRQIETRHDRWHRRDEDQRVADQLIWRTFTPLQAALYSGLEDVAEFLIQRGANLWFGPSSSGEKEHALHAAARHGLINTIKQLCSLHGAEVDVRDAQGYTPLAHAIISESTADVISCLLALGAQVNPLLPTGNDTIDGFTLLHLACWDRQWSRAAQLLAAGAEPEAIYTPHEFPKDSWPHHWQHVCPLRPLDLVCYKVSRTSSLKDPPRRETQGDQKARVALLVSLIRDYGVSTDSCPGMIEGDPPLDMAAEDDSASLEMLIAARDAGAPFRYTRHTLHGVLRKCSRSEGGLVDVHVPVMHWLLDNGVQFEVNESDRDDVLFKDIAQYLDTELKAGNTDRAAETMGKLIKQGRMSHILSGPKMVYDQIHYLVEWNRDDGLRNCFFRLLLSLAPNQGRDREKLFDCLMECGTQPPDMDDVLRDLLFWVPPLNNWQRLVYRAREMKVWAERDYVSSRPPPRPSRGPDQMTEDDLAQLLGQSAVDLQWIIKMVGRYVKTPELEELRSYLFDYDAFFKPFFKKDGGELDEFDHSDCLAEQRKVCRLIVELMKASEEQQSSQEFKEGIKRFINLARKCKADIEDRLGLSWTAKPIFPESESESESEDDSEDGSDEDQSEDDSEDEED